MTKSPRDGRWPPNSRFRKTPSTPFRVRAAFAEAHLIAKWEPISMVRRSRAPLLAASLIACGLAGCSSVTPVATNVDTPGMPNAEVALQKSMDETAGELGRIGAMQPAAAVASKPTIVPGELERVVAMSWNGGLDGAVRKLADTIGYRVAFSGNASRAVNVVVDPAPQRVYDILHGLGDQAGDTATVRVDAQHQLLEVIYHG
jgi:defect in organelle trafficking protein DotD